MTEIETALIGSFTGMALGICLTKVKKTLRKK